MIQPELSEKWENTMPSGLGDAFRAFGSSWHLDKLMLSGKLRKRATAFSLSHEGRRGEHGRRGLRYVVPC